MVVTVIPPLEKMGIPPLAAHMYALFWGVLSNVIPPVAIASFAAAGIAKADPMKTAIMGFCIGIPGLLVFATFVYNPALLLMGTLPDIIINSVGCIVGVICMSAAIQGHAFIKVNFLYRVILAVSALVVLNRRWDLTFLGMAFGIAILVLNYIIYKKKAEKGEMGGLI
jgi:TRAP-type uncharacterized transport system fused permease subunit